MIHKKNIEALGWLEILKHTNQKLLECIQMVDKEFENLIQEKDFPLKTCKAQMFYDKVIEVLTFSKDIQNQFVKIERYLKIPILQTFQEKNRQALSTLSFLWGDIQKEVTSLKDLSFCWTGRNLFQEQKFMKSFIWFLIYKNDFFTEGDETLNRMKLSPEEIQEALFTRHTTIKDMIFKYFKLQYDFVNLCIDWKEKVGYVKEALVDGYFSFSD
jgi:hypothetical protein